jgi:hypothetical protein
MGQKLIIAQSARSDLHDIVQEIGHDDLRELIHNPIRIIYRVRPDVIEVVRFWHAIRGTPEP